MKSNNCELAMIKYQVQHRSLHDTTRIPCRTTETYGDSDAEFFNTGAKTYMQNPPQCCGGNGNDGGGCGGDGKDRGGGVSGGVGI